MGSDEIVEDKSSFIVDPNTLRFVGVEPRYRYPKGRFEGI